MELTTKEFATLQGIDYQTAAGLLRYLTQKGHVQEAGKKRSSGKGKPSTVWCLPARIELVFAEAVAEAA